MHRGSILLVDDEEKILKALGRALRDAGHRVVDTPSPREAQRLLAERPFDLLVVDNVMPELGGLELIREYVNSTPEGERGQVLMMTAHATVESAIEAMKLGALDYLQKPFEIDELLVVVRRALDHQRLRTEHRYLLSERDEQFDHYGIIGRSRAVEEVIRRAELVAETKSTVLITGETGTGKELVARAIHDRSAQRDMPLIKVNCAAIPETLLESELFGYVKGSFTGANENRQGLFQAAHGGTLFMDEIGNMSLTMQVKLYRVLQEGKVRPIGSTEETDVDVRIIAATNKDFEKEIAEGHFREDLYYRLSVIPIQLPPLRERREDIPLLARHFLDRFRTSMNKTIEGISPEAVRRLEAYDWPGNVRELENTMERAVALEASGEISLGVLPDRVAGYSGASIPIGVAAATTSFPPEGLDFEKEIANAERRYIQAALEKSDGVRTKAADLLKITYRSFRHYAKKHDL